MNLKLWKNFTKKSKSTLRPTAAADYDLTVYLKEDTTLDKPTFLLDSVDLSCNYAQFSGRYYFIQDIRMGITHQYEVECITDYAATYKNIMGQSTFFIERSSHTYDVNITDNYISQKQTYAILQHQVNVFDDLGYLSVSSGSFILRVVGAQGIQTQTVENPGITSYLVAPWELEQILDFLFTDTNFTDVITDGIVKAFFNPFQYIVDLIWVPIDIFNYDLHHPSALRNQVRIGWWNTLVGAIVLNENFYSTEALPTFTKRYNDFRDLNSDWTKFKVYAPLIGQFEISAIDVYQDDLYIHYLIDSVSGSGLFLITHGSNNASGAKIIYQETFDFGVKVQIGQVATNVVNIGSNLLSAAGSAVSGNYVSTATSVMNAIMNTIQPTPSVKGQSANKIIYKNPFLSILRYTADTAEIPMYFSGRPLYQHKQISSIPGYIKCADADIDLSGLAGDREQVNSLLNGGFYYE